MHPLREIISALKEIQRPCVLATLVSPASAGRLPGSRRLLDPGDTDLETEGLETEGLDAEDLLEAEGLQKAADAALASDRPALHRLPDGAVWMLESLRPGRLAPWIHFAAQQRGLGRACVPAAIIEVSGQLPYQVGETFALDAHSHGLVPLDRTLNGALHHACTRAREEGAPRIERILVPGGEVVVLLDPL